MKSWACWFVRSAVAVVLVFGGGTPQFAGAESVVDAVGQEAEVNAASAASQKAIDGLSDDAESLAAEYRATLQATRSLDVYNRQLETLSAAQDREVESLQRQIERVTEVSREILPLMVRMIDSLEKFVALDVPFLEEERRDRVRQLRDMMDRSDVTISEKYRRLLESYQIEYDYGRNIEAYSGDLDGEGSKRTVDFLRIGRLALLYQTLDGNETGVWNQQDRAWEVLDTEYRSPVADGIRMARKQVAPDLIRVPLPAAETLQ